MKYEVHLTIHNIFNYDQFKLDCLKLNIKPIFLHLHTAKSTLNDIMTSSIFEGNDISVIEYCTMLSTKLSEYGYNVIRIKVETPPYHYKCPTDANGISHELCNYYETHLPVIVNSPDELIQLCDGKAHVSKNIFKTIESGSVYMVTIRNKLTLEKFLIALEHLKQQLMDNGYTILKKYNVEFCLYDSNIQHDNIWIYGN